ncbi:hypothetical protein MMC30_001967 [Trapelia coarctata]|nr:hypothetical protein [Trapelia coarctata]
MCVESHKTCSSGEPVTLPTRLLEVRTEDGNPSLRLVQPEGARGRYAALSHCWGTFGGLQTTKSTVDDHRNRVNASELSKTVHDAVLITRGLNLNYLWVDTLCIIQDDEQDWKCESLKMDLVYRQAYITIAAAGAKDGREGCFFSRKPLPDPVTVPVTYPPSREVAKIIFKMHTGSVAAGLAENPLNKRGWCLQESILSPRIIHFGKGRVLWQCHKSFVAEDYWNLKRVQLASWRGHASQPHTPSVQELSIDAWFNIIEDYTRRNLTKEEDKLYAINGLANLLRVSTGDTYCCGLWLKRLHQGLLWISSDGNMQHPSKHRAPSWSWAALDGPIYHLHALQFAINQTIPKAAVLRFGPDEASVKSSADSLTLFTCTKRVFRSDQTVIAFEFARLSSKALANLLYDHRDMQCHALLSPDNDYCGWASFDEESFSEEKMFCALISTVMRGSTFQAYNVLILGLVDGGEERLRRLGVGEVTQRGWFEGLEEREAVVV